MRHQTEHKRFGEPDETRAFPNGHAEIPSVGEAEVLCDEPAMVVDWYGANYAEASA